MDAPTTGLAAWRAAIRDRSFLIEAVVTIVVLVVGLASFTRFLAFVEARPGVNFIDPILDRFAPVDLSGVTFGLIYIALLAALAFLAREPRRLLMALQAYTVMLLFRTIAMYTLPLEPPATMIPLVDPIVGSAGAVDLPTKDLFFSGHTSTMFLLALSARRRWQRWIFLAATVGVAACVLAQHVHYTVDVFVAPFVAYASWRLVILLHRS